MPDSRKPPRQPRSSRSLPPGSSRASSPKVSGSAARAALWEAAVAEVRGENASLRASLESARQELDGLRKRMDLIESRLRKLPPPLPELAHEVIIVDEHDVTLESLRPKAGR